MMQAVTTVPKELRRRLVLRILQIHRGKYQASTVDVSAFIAYLFGGLD
jgi:hypothetical protein